jgi:hemoglobin
MLLYDQLGQEPGISKAVDEFYERVLAGRALQYFSGADVDKVRQHQVPQQYSGRALDVTHRRLGITHEHFDRVVDHLAGTLDDLGAPADVRDQVTAVLVAQRDAVVSAPQA